MICVNSPDKYCASIAGDLFLGGGVFSASQAAAALFRRGMEVGAADLYAFRYAVCAAWSRSKRIYAFDTDLAALLVDTPPDDAATVSLDLCHRLPADSFYVCAPAVLLGMDGFFLFWDKTDLRLRFLFLSEDRKHSIPAALSLGEGECSFSDACGDIPSLILSLLGAAYSGDQSALSLFLSHDLPAPVPALQKLLYSALQLVLYLSADNVELAAVSPAEGENAEILLHSVGRQLGAQIRSVTATSRRAHTRKGHFHTYWVGSKSDPAQRKRVIRWVAPVFIRPAGFPEDIAVIPVSE